MPSAEFEKLVEAVRLNPPLKGDSVLAMRAHLDAITEQLPPPAGVTLEPVDAGGVSAEWTTPEEAMPERTIVYLHGGGYGIGSLASHRDLVARLARAADARILNVAYRLAPEHPFPAAVEDAVAAYRHVMNSGIAPARIAIAGDSAGGGLAVASLIALRDAGDTLPAAGVCISPWLDLAFTGASWEANAEIDPVVTRPKLQLLADAYLAGSDPRMPTASPLYADLRGLPPILIQVGTAEVLLDDARTFALRAAAAGVHIDLDCWEDMFHVWHAFADFFPETGAAIARIAAFLRARID